MGVGGPKECWTPIALLLFKMDATVGKIACM